MGCACGQFRVRLHYRLAIIFVKSDVSFPLFSGCLSPLVNFFFRPGFYSCCCYCRGCLQPPSERTRRMVGNQRPDAGWDSVLLSYEDGTDGLGEAGGVCDSVDDVAGASGFRLYAPFPLPFSCHRSTFLTFRYACQFLLVETPVVFYLSRVRTAL